MGVENGEMAEFRIPDFVVNLIGRLQLENASLLAQLQALQVQLAEHAEKVPVQSG